MAQEQAAERREPPRWRRPPSVSAARRVIDHLRRFQDLVRHHQRWAHSLDFARPLHELIPEAATEGAKQYWLIEREVHRLIPLVSRYLYDAGVSTQVITRDEKLEYDFEKSKQLLKQTERKYDLIVNYFELPRSGSAEFFDLLIGTADRGIGVWQVMEENARRRRYNPLTWLGALLRLPLTVLDAASLTDEQTPSRIVTAYAWLMRILLLVSIALAMTKLGVSIPWDKLLTGFR